jgi:hypothetical protein
MTINQMWDRIEARQGQRLFTLSQRRPFDVVRADRHREVVVTPEQSGIPRPIKAHDFVRSYELWCRSGGLRPVDLRGAGIADWSISYVAAIIINVAAG